MNKAEFIAKLEDKLRGLPQSDINKSLDYYSEMIDERIDEGMDENEAVAQLGDINDIATQILMETPLPELVKAKAKAKSKISAGEAALLAMGSPLWITLLIAAAIVALAVYVIIWSFIGAVYCGIVAMAAEGALCLVAGVSYLIKNSMQNGLLLVGLCPLFIGGALMLLPPANCLAKQIIKLSRSVVIWVKSIVVGRGKRK